MKKNLFIAIVAFGCVFSVCGCEEVVEKIEWESEIIDVSGNEHDKTFILKNGYTVCVKWDKVWIYDRSYEQMYSSNHEAENAQWVHAEKGMIAQKRTWSSDCFYEIKAMPDYQKERVVKSISVYDRDLKKISGSLEITGGLLTASGSGNIEGAEKSAENMFLNIFFEDGEKPITVNVRDNRLWLDLEPGGKVLEQRVNNKIFYSPMF